MPMTPARRQSETQGTIELNTHGREDIGQRNGN
jgi:hypothetical protein